MAWRAQFVHGVPEYRPVVASPLTVFRKNGKSFQYVMGFLCETAVSSSVFCLNWGVNDHKN